jgi:DeoR/GlpR family transcriptional regulator of sugar metabolism
VGNITAEVFARFNLDMVFMGTHGIDNEFGFSSPNLVESETNREVMRHATLKVIMADHTKWGIRGFSSFASFEAADVLITSQGLGSQALELLSARMREVRVAKS